MAQNFVHGERLDHGDEYSGFHNREFHNKLNKYEINNAGFLVTW
jgi:hypothetical protein